ncbi:hypothetical protein AK812_SmicGene18749 [Symbiodinium microadriaticum]|uniref:Uncharacterized protein n=1 Tax=Symbiodinium microadriaticum TaxID=2951 RepID=A0A1Q9DUA1_SYMMI|nr:hypothetical protein AK812_SmicGene18749 [Symbiodinium microadriaticum]
MFAFAGWEKKPHDRACLDAGASSRCLQSSYHLRTAHAMADRRPNRPPVKFREGCMIFGNTTLGHSSVKFRPRRRQQDPSSLRCSVT